MHQQLIKAPLVTVDRVDSFDIYAHLDGGGPSGQAGALRLAIARALILVQPEDRPALKKAGFLTRDPRAIERKKYGLKKARKAPQYSQALICTSPPGMHPPFWCRERAPPVSVGSRFGDGRRANVGGCVIRLHL